MSGIKNRPDTYSPGRSFVKTEMLYGDEPESLETSDFTSFQRYLQAIWLALFTPLSESKAKTPPETRSSS